MLKPCITCRQNNHVLYGHDGNQSAATAVIASTKPLSILCYAMQPDCSILYHTMQL